MRASTPLPFPASFRAFLPVFVVPALLTAPARAQASTALTDTVVATSSSTMAATTSSTFSTFSISSASSASSAMPVSPTPASPLVPAERRGGHEVWSSLSFGTHMRYAQPLITFGLGAAGHVDYSAPGVGRPGVEVSYGRFGLSTSGSFLTDPLDRLWRAGRSPRGDAQDVRTRYHGTHWGVEAHHLTARGFEVAGVVNQQSVAGYRPDVRLRATGATIYRSFDPASHVYRLSEGQLETGGDVDVFLTAGVSHAGLQGEHPLLTAMAATDSRFAHAERIAVSSATVGGGFAITSNLHGLYFDQSLFGGYGPQYRVWGERSDVTWNLAKVNLRVALGVRTRWFDAGVGVEDEAYASLAGSDRMVVHALAAQAHVKVFL